MVGQLVTKALELVYLAPCLGIAGGQEGFIGRSESRASEQQADIKQTAETAMHVYLNS